VRLIQIVYDSQAHLPLKCSVITDERPHEVSHTKNLQVSAPGHRVSLWLSGYICHSNHF